MTKLLLAAQPSQASGAQGLIVNIVLLVAMFGVIYFFMIRPQKKREKEMQSMRSKMEIGDEVITNGGIVGRVVSIKDDTVVIETGTDRSKIRFLRNAIQFNNTASANLKSQSTK